MRFDYRQHFSNIFLSYITAMIVRERLIGSSADVPVYGFEEEYDPEYSLMVYVGKICIEVVTIYT